jgi:ubiquinone/menaquinone biosynthesis C-methylase UbiE
MDNGRRVCPAQIAGMLDNPLRCWIHPRKTIVGPYVKEGDCVLDLGCGPGSFTDTLADLAGDEGRVIAVDLQKEMLDLMVKKITVKNQNHRVIPHLCRQDSLLLDVYTGQVDFALAFWMAHETPDLGAFFGQVFAALKLKGRLLCVEPKMHVSKRQYGEMFEIGRSLGFHCEPVEGIRLSRSVLFTK